MASDNGPPRRGLSSVGDLIPPHGYPRATRGRIVVWGLLASLPFGGMTWQVLHYLSGLRRLGFDVWYVEDSDTPVHDPTSWTPTDRDSTNVAYLAHQMDRIGLSDRWVFRRPGTNKYFGALDRRKLQHLYAEVDAAFNLCGAQEPRDNHEVISCRVYVQTDPVALQVAVAAGSGGATRIVDAHDYLFTYAENLGQPDCDVPTGGLRWFTTRPPVCTDWWPTERPDEGSVFTTVTAWEHIERKPAMWRGKLWRWNKRVEWERFLPVAARSPYPLEMAIGPVDPPPDEWARITAAGWRVSRAASLIEPDDYRDYIVGSRGEFTVAKEQYVVPRTGWFSDRSVCYLAAGRPVVTQDTGFDRRLPIGSGLLAYATIDQAVSALEAVRTDYEAHSRSAREIARAYLEAELVLDEMLRQISL